MGLKKDFNFWIKSIWPNSSLLMDLLFLVRHRVQVKKIFALFRGISACVAVGFSSVKYCEIYILHKALDYSVELFNAV